ncbi:hypothetical protein Pla144_15200 [Bythopirellula polymerisocia]|uniref:Uncharacterized protein n=1 Tax=Bythopirellula polymerisocia TaxID=2528003 RepID=A0A5C6CTH1_9BACT|nr:hypothetical protein Pla144_15200 [Bythopirellula polymerisocia]
MEFFATNETQCGRWLQPTFMKQEVTELTERIRGMKRGKLILAHLHQVSLFRLLKISLPIYFSFSLLSLFSPIQIIYTSCEDLNR